MERTFDLDEIVSQGIIPAIQRVVEDESITNIDYKVCLIGNLINAYEDYFRTGRHVNGVERIHGSNENDD